MEQRRKLGTDILTFISEILQFTSWKVETSSSVTGALADQTATFNEMHETPVRNVVSCIYHGILEESY